MIVYVGVSECLYWLVNALGGLKNYQYAIVLTATFKPVKYTVEFVWLNYK